jgi:hypothetical protein
MSPRVATLVTPGLFKSSLNFPPHDARNVTAVTERRVIAITRR